MRLPSFSMASLLPSVFALLLLEVELIVVVNLSKAFAGTKYCPNGLKQLILNQ